MSNRPLPAKPNLEFERKQAKKLLAELRRGDANALARLHDHKADVTSPEEIKLADAQFTIAREYGFLSWPRLVEYFKTLRAHESSRGSEQHAREFYEQSVQGILRGHEKRNDYTGLLLAAFIPRFYGLTLEEVFASPITIDDARLAVAREAKFASWDDLLEHTRQYRGGTEDPWQYFLSPWAKASRAIRESNLEELQRIVREHPEVLNGDPDRPMYDLMLSALGQERRRRTPEVRRITDWLIAQGVDPTETFGRMLLGPPWGRPPKADDVAFLLERGADPNWIAPNGIPLLEHALYRYWNHEAVDLIARRATPRKAFWIACGLGDVRSLDQYIDRTGALKGAARKNRPDFMALWHGMPQNLHADDHEIIWEGFLVAGLNSRFAVLDVLLDRGFPIDYSQGGLGMPLLNLAVGNRWFELAAYLVKRGANVDLPINNPSARRFSEMHLLQSPNDPKVRRLHELCRGRDLETLTNERAAVAREEFIAPGYTRFLEQARKVAGRAGKTEVETEDLFIALLSDWNMVSTLSGAGVDIARLHHTVGPRLTSANGEEDYSALAFSRAANEDLEAAKALQKEREPGETVYLHHVLCAIFNRETGPVARLIEAAGSTPATIKEAVEYRFFQREIIQ